MHVINGGPAAISNDYFWDVRNVAKYLSVTPKWVYEHVASGHVPHRRLVRLIRFTHADIDAWLMSRLSGYAGDEILDGTPLIDTDNLAEYLGVSRSWIYEARRSKHMPCFRLDGKLRFSRALVDSWVASFATCSSGATWEARDGR